MSGLNSLPAVLGASLVSFLVNSFSVAGIVSLLNSQNIFDSWRRNFLWAFPGYLVGAVLSFSVVSLWGEQLDLLLLTLLPVVFLAYHVFQRYLKQEKELAKSQKELAELYLSTVRSLALAIDAKDHYTHEHILRVQKYAMATAEKMNVAPDILKAIETGALLHDIGKIGIPDHILLKKGRLSDEEFAEVKRHPVVGSEILAGIPFPWNVIPIVKYHHERWDGTGYPEQLQGEEIPLVARILTVADVYDALTSDRSYRSAWSHEEACKEICHQSGKQFDPVVVSAFLEVIDHLRIKQPSVSTHPDTYGATDVPVAQRDPITTPARLSNPS